MFYFLFIRDVLISQDAIVNHLPVKMTVMEKMTF